MTEKDTTVSGQKWTTFYLDSQHRDHILGRYTFYLSQARERIFPLFGNIETQSQQHSDEWFKNAGLHFNPDTDDVGTYAEMAWEKGLHYGLMLRDVRNDVCLGILAGLYHRWDKDLREWVVSELAQWLNRELIEKKIWHINRHTLCQLLDAMGITVTTQPFYPIIQAYGKLVNVYKHGKGDAFDALRRSHPEYFHRDVQSDAYWKFSAHDDLAVSDEQFDVLTCSLFAFWRCIPQSTSSEDGRDVIPKWFIQQIESD